MNSVSNILPSFMDAYKQGESFSTMKEKLSKYIPDLISQTDSDLLLNELESLDKKVLKVFFQAIPSGLMSQLYRFAKENSNLVSERSCTYIVIQHCKNKNTPYVQSVYNMMKKMDISEEYYRYKLAMFAAKQDPFEFSNEVADFNINRLEYKRRLEEVALYHNAGNFLENLNEFEIYDEKDREAYFLRGMVRSTDLVQDLLLDTSFFMPSLIKKLSITILEFLYKNFKFCEITTQIALEENNIIKSKRRSMSEFKEIPKEKFILSSDMNQTTDCKSAFISIFKNPCLSSGISLWDFFRNMEERDKCSLLAMIILIKQLPNAEEMIQNPDFLVFLKELDSFPDPAGRFAAVAIALSEIDKGKSLIEQLNYIKTISTDELKGQYPKICSLSMSSCDLLLSSKTASSWIFQQWKHASTRKHFICFLAEFLLSEKLQINRKKKVLTDFINNPDLHKSEVFRKTLIDFSVCLSSGLTKEIIEGISPTEILRNREMFFINRLGAPYELSVNEELFQNLKHTREFAYYAQSLEKLSEQSEKDRMVPFFFKFLESMANHQMITNRMNTPEMQELFTSYSLNKEAWENGTEFLIQDLILSPPEERELNIPAALEEAFNQGHLQVNEYQAFSDYAFLKLSVTPPLLESKTFGQYSLKGSTEKEKKAAISHLFCKLLEEKKRPNQLSLIKQLIKFFHPSDGFYSDLSQWQAALGQKKQAESDRWNKLKGYKIIRSNDPYLLFLIGSIAGETCQRVTGDPAKNKCLLGYPSDGKNQLIFAQLGTKDPEACALLRFFYACDNKMTDQGSFIKLFPVLYLEPIYPAGKDSLLEEGIIFSAIQCARELGVPLVRHFKCREKQDSDADYPFKLSTINGPAPFEYFDGLPGVKENNYESEHGSSSNFYGWIDGSKIKLLYEPNSVTK